MAKIAIITDDFSEQSYLLANALQAQRHDVTILCSQDCDIPENLQIPVLRCFKSWTWLEALLVFPRLISHRFEIWHFILKTPQPAALAIAHLVSPLPKKIVCVSFFESLSSTSRLRLQLLLKACDIITAGTREQMMYLKRNRWVSTDTQTQLLPPMITEQNLHFNSEVNQDLQRLTNSMKPFLLVPSSEAPVELMESPFLDQLLDRVQLVVCGPRPKKYQQLWRFQQSSPHICFIGNQKKSLSNSDLLFLSKQSLGILTSFCPMSSVDLMLWLRLSSLTEKPLIANSRQTESFPDFCVHQKNGFLIKETIQALIALLDQNPSLKLSHPQFVLAPTTTTDSALNELNRLYSKTMDLKLAMIDFKSSSLS